MILSHIGVIVGVLGLYIFSIFIGLSASDSRKLEKSHIFYFFVFVFSIMIFVSCFGIHYYGYKSGQIDVHNGKNHVYLERNEDNSTEWSYTTATTKPGN